MLPAGALAAAVPPDVEACGTRDQQRWLCRLVVDLTDSSFAGRVADNVGPLVDALLIILAAWLGNRLVRLAIRRIVRRLEQPDARGRWQWLRRRTGLALLEKSTTTPVVRRHQRVTTIAAGVRSLLSVVIWGIATIGVITAFGIELAPLLAGAGLVGVALGFGAQSLVRDFLAGTFMIFEDQFGVGDVIDVGHATGTVEAVSLRVTRLRDVEGVVWHVPNGQILRVGNTSQQWSRAVIDVPLPIDTDVARASAVLKETADAMWREEAYQEVILGEPEVWGVEDLGKDGLSIRLVVKTMPLQQWTVARELRARLAAALDAAGLASRPG